MGDGIRAMVQVGPERLEMQEFARPQVGDDDALLRIEACGICAWAGEDLNLRRQCRRVYSPFPLATRAPTQRGTTLPAREVASPLISGAIPIARLRQGNAIGLQ